MREMRGFSAAPISAALMYMTLGCLLALPTLVTVGCTSGEGAGRAKFLSLGTAPGGGTFPVVGDVLSQVLNDHKGENNWKVQAKGTKGSQENIRRLAQDELELALSNSAITYFAVRGESDWNEEYKVRAVMTLAPNVAMFVTPSSSGIQTMQDLRGKRVVCGPSGAGFEMFVGPILEAHGLSFDDFEKLNNTPNNAVDMLGDGSADAAFLGGAVPNPAIQTAATKFDVHLIPFDPAARQQLIEEYPFFSPITIKAGTYSGVEEDYSALNVGSMHLITSAGQDEELIYQVTKTLYENREEAASKHGAAKSINAENAPRYTGTPFHDGAIKFYKEIGIWKDDASQDQPAGEGPTESETAKEAGANEATVEPDEKAEPGKENDGKKEDAAEPADPQAGKDAGEKPAVKEKSADALPADKKEARPADAGSGKAAGGVSNDGDSPLPKAADDGEATEKDSAAQQAKPSAEGKSDQQPADDATTP